MFQKALMNTAASLAIGLAIGYGAKVENRTKVIVQEVQPKCEHKFRSLSCVINGDTASSKTANVIQECEKCGSVRRERLYL